MSERYPGGIISKTPVVPTTTSAPGIWTLDQQLQAQKSGIWPIPYTPTYIEEVFSTYLYTGNGSTQTITNGIDLAGQGGMVWLKNRSPNSFTEVHGLFDTARGVRNALFTNQTNAQTQVGASAGVTAFNSSGFTTVNNANPGSGWNNTDITYASWTFRKQPKFFDIQTWTGTGVYNRQTKSHNLASVPACVIIKAITATGSWYVYHTSTGLNQYTYLNTTDAPFTSTGFWGTTPFTSTTFTVPYLFDDAGVQYEAYLFASNAGGFGLTGTDNVISCGSFNSGSFGSTVNVTLGYEPQWLLIKNISSTEDWRLCDNMRGWANTGGYGALQLEPNLSNSENTDGLGVPTATGFMFNGSNSNLSNPANYIYIAIRRGPMKVPTDGTSVFSPATWTGNGTTGRNISTGFPVDLTLEQIRTSTSIVQANLWFDRLRGYSSIASANSYFLRSPVTDAESSVANYNYVPTMDGFNFGSVANSIDQYNSTNVTAVAWNFRRAPSFFDEVCYTGTGASRTLTHNLAAAPELVIIKARSAAYSWSVGSLFTSSNFSYYTLESTDAGQTFAYTAGVVFNGQPTASSVFLNSSGGTNQSGQSYVAYLFATCPGVSKVGSYTGNASNQNINCGFTGGARFVMIKRTDSTGDWYVWDTARGMVAGTDPSLLLNSVTAEVNANNIYTFTGGFQISSTAAGINASGGSYIFLAIA